MSENMRIKVQIESHNLQKLIGVTDNTNTKIDVPQVCDFGFSRVEARDDDEMRRISYCGTDGYMVTKMSSGYLVFKCKSRTSPLT